MFTDHAKRAVVGALERARGDHAPEVLPEHLLLHLLAHPDTPAGTILSGCGIEASGVLEALRTARRRGGLTDGDAEALEEFGIDLDAVVGRVEEMSGEYALAAAGPARSPWRFRNSPPFSAELKLVLKSAGSEAQEVRSGRLEDTHLLLALLRRPGVVRETLARHGLTYARARAAS
ncbi:MAG TPA: Clp protease N-terminal domain-containing protein [Mycobacteriales bacterium]|nr:Clp protease N-terminal domain-containing protein [Mycobacteriales bacterium]